MRPYIEHWDEAAAMVAALYELNAAVLAAPNCEETALQFAQAVRSRFGQMGKAELVDALHQTAIDYETNVRRK